MESYPQRFINAVTALVNAYNKGTLKAGNSCTCALGTIIAYANGWTLTKANEWNDGHRPNWCVVFGFLPIVREKEYKGEAKRQLDSTGYHWRELLKVEEAFESSKSNEEGINNVIDILIEVEDHYVNKDQLKRQLEWQH